jgi:hypothetical protein
MALRSLPVQLADLYDVTCGAWREGSGGVSDGQWSRGDHWLTMMQCRPLGLPLMADLKAWATC